jgi:hypothetical protein
MLGVLSLVGTIRKRGKKWTIDYTDGAGKRRRQDFASKSAADTALAKATVEAGQALPPTLADVNITVREYFGQAADLKAGTSATGWIGAVASSVKRKTWASYEQTGRLYIVPALGHLSVRQMHRAHIKTFVANLLTDRKDQLARSSVRIIFATLRVMLSAAVEDGVILANPAFGVGRKMKLGRAARISDAEDGEVKPFASYEELARFLETARVYEPVYNPRS